MNSIEHNDTDRPTSQWDEILAGLETMYEAAEMLHTALSNNNADAIWQAAEAQEKAAAQLGNISFDPGQIDQSFRTELARQDPEKAALIRGLAQKIKAIQRINRLLSTTLVKVTDNTLNNFTQRFRQAPITYGARGNWNREAGPVMVQQTG